MLLGDSALRERLGAAAREAVERARLWGSRARTRPRSGEAESLSARPARRLVRGSCARVPCGRSPAAGSRPERRRRSSRRRGPIELWRSPAFEHSLLAGSGSRAPARLPRSVRGGRPRPRPPRGCRGRAGAPCWPGSSDTRLGREMPGIPIHSRPGPGTGSRRSRSSPKRPRAPSSRASGASCCICERNVEDDILGNHVIRNARALLLGAAAFGSAGAARRRQRICSRGSCRSRCSPTEATTSGAPSTT